MNDTEICRKMHYLLMKQKGKYILSLVYKLGQRLRLIYPTVGHRDKTCVREDFLSLSQLEIKRQQIIASSTLWSSRLF